MNTYKLYKMYPVHFFQIYNECSTNSVLLESVKTQVENVTEMVGYMSCLRVKDNMTLYNVGCIINNSDHHFHLTAKKLHVFNQQFSMQVVYKS